MSKKDYSSWVKYSQIGIQMGVTIGVLAWFGAWLDGDEGKTYTIIFSLLGVFVAIYIAIKQVLNHTKDQ